MEKKRTVIMGFFDFFKKGKQKMTGFKDIQEALEAMGVGIAMSEDMQNAIEDWKRIYRNKPKWKSDNVYSLNLGKSVCQELQTLTLSEFNAKVLNDEILDTVLDEKVIAPLYANLEKALAVGGCIFKPSIKDGEISVSMVLQGDFIPIAYDEDGNIVDVVFVDQYREGKYLYTKLERQAFDKLNKVVYIENYAYKGEKDELGKPIDLTATRKWANIEQSTVINNIEHRLYGIFKCPMANNIDLNSPLGVSVFNSATELMQRADEQYSRLDWEYEGGQIAIDVDQDAIKDNMDETSCRLYRKCNVGDDGDTYHAFAPVLRSTDYRNGLNLYLAQIENQCGLARGTLAEPQVDARTATEIKMTRQKTYMTVHALQKALKHALEDTIVAMWQFAILYRVSSVKEIEYTVDFGDSVLTDMQSEMEQKVMLVNIGAISKGEVRAWYTGEPIEEAENKVKDFEEKIVFTDNEGVI